MHPLAWVAWTALVMTIALTSTNPYYHGLVLVSIVLVAASAPRTAQGTTALRTVFVFAVIVLVMSVGISVINGGYGEHVLFTMPSPRAPDWLGGLAIGGPVSAESLVAGATRGAGILCVLLAFATFNASVSPQRVLRTAPAALFHAGLVVTIGLSLLPASIDDMRRLRELRAVRGAPSGLRSVPSLVVPAVIGGLERSMRLAEAMEARGYAAAEGRPRWLPVAGALSPPVLLAAAITWFYYPAARPLAALLVMAGVVVLAGWAIGGSRNRATTRYHDERMPWQDRALMVVSFAGAAAVVVASSMGAIDLAYNPFAGLAAPTFGAAEALIAASAAWPAFLHLARGAAPAGGGEGLRPVVAP
jgi:energy-coupling factor transport system permease protein